MRPSIQFKMVKTKKELAKERMDEMISELAVAAAPAVVALSIACVNGVCKLTKNVYGKIKAAQARKAEEKAERFAKEAENAETASFEVVDEDKK